MEDNQDMQDKQFADNIQPVQLTENVSPKVIESSTTNEQPLPDNMEAHHHSHIHHSKKWKDYLFEFIMLFLAVFCGFLAENWREHYIEHKRARVFAASMVGDLASDTVELKDYVKYMSYAARNVDTLLQLLLTSKPNEIPSGNFYWYGLWGGAASVFVPNVATFQQMKSSGSLRYFTNKSLSQKVAQYDQLSRKWITLEEIDQNIYSEVRKMRAQIFEFRYNVIANSIYQSDRLSPNQKRIDSFILTNPPLLTSDKAIFNVYTELVRSRFIPRKVATADTLLLHAKELITELEGEYHLP
jgi:hypothetical protein